jgi:hypothetical protein
MAGSMVAKFATFSRMEQRLKDRGQQRGGQDVPPVGEEHVTVDAKRPDLGH